jgi:hypothetical protein
MSERPIPRLQFGFSETAEALGVPVSTLELECRRGRGPKFYTMGRRKFTTVKLIEDWQNAKINELEQ